MARTKLTKSVEKCYMDNDDALKLIINILDAIETIKTRRKRPDEKSISYFMSSKHGLDNGMVLAVLEQLLDSGVLYTEIVRGSESYRINQEAETKIRAAGFELERIPEPKQQASCLAADPMVTPSEDSTETGISEEGEQQAFVAASRTRKAADSPLDESLDVDEHRNFVVTSSNEQNSFIADLNRLNLSYSSESDKIPLPIEMPLPLDNPPTPTLQPHSQGSEITRLAEIVLQLHDQIQQERQCNSELRNENANLKIRLGLLHQQENLSKTEDKNTAAACKSSGISKENSIEKIQAQWELCLDERRKKYEQFNVSKKLNNTKLNAQGKDSVKTKDIESQMVQLFQIKVQEKWLLQTKETKSTRIKLK